jgi:hypothetical protein
MPSLRLRNLNFTKTIRYFEEISATKVYHCSGSTWRAKRADFASHGFGCRIRFSHTGAWHHLRSRHRPSNAKLRIEMSANSEILGLIRAALSSNDISRIGRTSSHLRRSSFVTRYNKPRDLTSRSRIRLGLVSKIARNQSLDSFRRSLVKASSRASSNCPRSRTNTVAQREALASTPLRQQRRKRAGERPTSRRGEAHPTTIGERFGAWSQSLTAILILKKRHEGSGGAT